MKPLADTFSCSGEVPGYALNCVGLAKAGYETITGQFAIGKKLCKEPRVDPLLTVTYAYLEKGVVTQAISGPFDLGRPTGCPPDAYSGSTRLNPKPLIVTHKKKSAKKSTKKKTKATPRRAAAQEVAAQRSDAQPRRASPLSSRSTSPGGGAQPSRRRLRAPSEASTCAAAEAPSLRSSVGPRLLRPASSAVLTVGLAACGSAKATATSKRPTAPRPRRPPPPHDSRPAAAAPLPTCACDGGKHARPGRPDASTDAAASGDDVAQAVGRVQSSTALASAIRSGARARAGAALRALLAGQIVRIEVLRGGHVLASAGAGPAIAPVRGSIPGTGASFVLSVQSDRGLPAGRPPDHGRAGAAALGRPPPGGNVRRPAASAVPTSGTLNYAGRATRSRLARRRAYPSGALRIALLVPSGALSCPGSTRADAR